MLLLFFIRYRCTQCIDERVHMQMLLGARALGSLSQGVRRRPGSLYSTACYFRIHVYIYYYTYIMYICIIRYSPYCAATCAVPVLHCLNNNIVLYIYIYLYVRTRNPTGSSSIICVENDSRAPCVDGIILPSQLFFILSNSFVQ